MFLVFLLCLLFQVCVYTLLRLYVSGAVVDMIGATVGGGAEEAEVTAAETGTAPPPPGTDNGRAAAAGGGTITTAGM